MQLFLNVDPNDSTVRLPYPLPHPNREAFVDVLTLYSRTKDLAAKQGPMRCLEIVDEMKDFSIKMGDLSLQPIAHDYNKVLLAWGTSKSPKKAFYAANLLQQMKRDDLWDEMSYNHVLRACAFSKFSYRGVNENAHQLAAGVALKVYHDMVKNNVKCTPITYSYFLRACDFLANDKQRDYEVEAAFLKCRDEGNVDDVIMLRLRHVASPQLWKKLMGNLAERERIQVNDLPTAWTRSVGS